MTAPTLDLLIEADTKARESRKVFLSYLTALQEGLTTVLTQENHTPQCRWNLPEEPHIGTWVDRQNETVWVRMDWETDDTTWFALNKHNFTGSGYPIAWVRVRDENVGPWSVYRPGDPNMDLEKRVSGLSAL